MTVCTTSGCDNEAEHGLFLFDEGRFSRAWGAASSSDTEPGDIHPHACDECESHYGAAFSNIGEMRRVDDDE